MFGKLKRNNEAELVGLIVTHLEFLGYEVIRDEDNGMLFATHKSKIEFYIVEPDEPGLGLMFGSRITCKPDVVNNLLAYTRFINDLNSQSTVARFFYDVESETCDLIFQAWYPGSYEKASFSLFIDMLLDDVTGQLSVHSEANRYLLAE